MSIRKHLRDGAPLLFDGAMGTLYAARSGREDVESAVLDHPEEIAAIHRAYLEAGCRALRTDTFDLTPDLLYHPERAAALAEAACRIAKEEAAPFGAWVFADFGPAPAEAALSPAELYRREADLFLAQGLTCFIAETLPSDQGIPELAAHLKERCPEAFLLVSYAVGPDGATRESLSGATLLERTAALPEVDAVGFNCMLGPHHLLEWIKRLNPALLHGKPLSVMPNAGYPTVLGRRVVYQGRPDYFAEQLRQIADAGARILGGCCGTTPQHMARAADALKGGSAPSPSLRIEDRRTTDISPTHNRFQEKLDAGERVVAIELDPPADDNIAPFLEGVQVLRDAGADAVTISDCPVGRPRVDSSLLACKIHRELGVDPIPHMTCRDRNLNATKALLLGLAMEGVRNILLVTGDPIPSENREEVRSVFNFNSRKLIRYVSTLPGNGIAAPFQIFAALNVNARNFDIQLRLAQEKEAAGAAGFLTQPVHSPEALDNLRRAREVLRGKLLGGIFPIVSHKNALFLNNEVPGIRVPEEIVDRYQGKSREECEDLAVELSCRIAADMKDCTDGLYLMTPFRRVSLMRRILEQSSRA